MKTRSDVRGMFIKLRSESARSRYVVAGVSARPSLMIAYVSGMGALIFGRGIVSRAEPGRRAGGAAGVGAGRGARGFARAIESACRARAIESATSLAFALSDC